MLMNMLKSGEIKTEKGKESETKNMPLNQALESEIEQKRIPGCLFVQESSNIQESVRFAALIKMFKFITKIIMTRLILIFFVSLVIGGCTRTNKVFLHPLEKDFQLVKAGQVVTVEKDGALVSNYFLSDVAGIEIEK